jgi:hypothetical protein
MCIEECPDGEGSRMPSTEGIPLHKETGASFHFHPTFMGKCALPGKECITLG